MESSLVFVCRTVYNCCAPVELGYAFPSCRLCSLFVCLHCLRFYLHSLQGFTKSGVLATSFYRLHASAVRLHEKLPWRTEKSFILTRFTVSLPTQVFAEHANSRDRMRPNNCNSGVVHTTKFSEGGNLFIRIFNIPLEIIQIRLFNPKFQRKQKTVDAILLDNLEQCFSTFLLKVAQITL